MIRISPGIPCWLVLLAIALLPACIRLEKPYPQKSTFVLETRREGNPEPVPADAVLLVRNFGNSASFQTRNFVYRLGELEYRSDFYNEFFASPAALVTEESSRWLRQAGLFGHITVRGEPAPTHLLRGRIGSLYGDYRPNRPPAAVFELQLILIDNRPVATAIVLDRHYRREIPLADRTPESLLGGWNSALEQILTEFEEDARRALLPVDPP